MRVVCSTSRNSTGTLAPLAALPAETANVLDATFICENPDCEAFGEPV